MRIEYKLPRDRRLLAETNVISPAFGSSSHPPRITCLLALAHRLEEMVQTGQVKDYAELAKVGHVSRTRVSQILKLLMPAPSIQELPKLRWLGVPRVLDVIEQTVPDEFKENFEFHAADLHQSRGPFSKLPPGKGLEIISDAVTVIKQISPAIIYGAVDTDRLQQSIYGNADAVSIGFRICAEAANSWIEKKGVSF